MQNLAVLTLPGTWSSLADFKAAITKQAPDYRFANGVLVNQRTREGVHVHFQMGHNPNLVDDFRCGGTYWYDTEDMRAISRHTSHVLLADAGGSRERMAQVMGAASAVVRAGALGVHVENAGVAHPAENWLALANDGMEGVFRAFVATIDAGSDGAHCSGMQNFGLKDVVVPAHVPDCTAVAGAFAWHLVVKEAKVAAGQMMTVGTKSASSYVRVVGLESVPAGSMFHNRFGAWQLLPATPAH